MKIVSEFCYLTDMQSAGGGCMQAIIARCTVSGKFKTLFPILTNKHLSLEARGRVFDVVCAWLCCMGARLGAQWYTT